MNWFYKLLFIIGAVLAFLIGLKVANW